MFNLFKLAFALAVAIAVGYFLYNVTSFVVTYLMAFVGIATGLFLIFEWALIAAIQIFFSVYIAGLLFAWIYSCLEK